MAAESFPSDLLLRRVLTELAETLRKRLLDMARSKSSEWWSRGVNWDGFWMAEARESRRGKGDMLHIWMEVM